MILRICSLYQIQLLLLFFIFFFQAEDGIRDSSTSRGLGDVYKRQTLAATERAALNQVAGLLSMPRGELDQLISMLNAQAQFQQRAYQQRGSRHHGNADGPSELDTAYAALGLTPSASASEVKRRYRKLMSENHPDKLIAEGVPDELLKVATARAQEISAAYEVIQRSRGTK